MAVRSIPMPNAQPEYFSGSMLTFLKTWGSTMPAPRISFQPVPPQTRQAGSLCPQTMHSMSTSAEGSVNGKKLGRKRILSFSPNRARMKCSSVPLRWANVMPSSTTRPSTW